MSDAYSIAAVTATLQHILSQAMIDGNAASILGGLPPVTALPLNRIPVATGQETTRLNLFLYRVSPNTFSRNSDLPTRDPPGQTLQPPTASLDLHYLLSAYGADELHQEALLGLAAAVFHQRPTISDSVIEEALATGGSPTNLEVALRDAGLASEREKLRIVVESLSLEDLFRIWSAQQAAFRPSLGVRVGVVRISQPGDFRPTFPVLTRGPADSGIMVTPSLVPPLPQITRVEAPGGRVIPRIGETITLHGINLAGSGHRVEFRPAFSNDPPLVFNAASADNSTVTLDIPNDNSWRTGVYNLRVLLIPTGESQERNTNLLPTALGPAVTSAVATRAADQTVSLDLTVLPAVHHDQTFVVSLGNVGRTPPPVSAPETNFTVDFPDMPAGQHLLRVSIDGIASVTIQTLASPPTFEPAALIDVP